MASPSSSDSETHNEVLHWTESDSLLAHGRPSKSPNPVTIETVGYDQTNASPDGASDDPQGGSEAWNSPRVNIFRFSTCCFALFVMGMHDASLGALLPYIGPYYDVGYTTVSTVFIVPVVGYVITAITNNWVHNVFGQRGVAFIGPFMRLVAYVPLLLHPPFPLLPVLFTFAGIGNGAEDGAYNAWVGNMQQANELLGLMHGAYGFGATIGPLVATTMVTKGELPWYYYYYVMIGMNCIALCTGVASFWSATGAAYRERLQKDGAGREATPLSTVLKGMTTWLIALFLLGYVGVEVSMGGWIPTFMIEVRHVSGFLAGLTATLFWLGLTLGRVVLGFVTGRVGERRAILVYLSLCITSVFVYWLVPNFVVAIASVILLGFFMGPLFPAAIVLATKLLPSEHHISAIGFSAAIGSGGAAVIPFAVGAIAQSNGVRVLQPIAIVILIFITGVWLIVPGGLKKGRSARPRYWNAAPGADLMRIINQLFDGFRRRRAIILDDHV